MPLFRLRNIGISCFCLLLTLMLVVGGGDVVKGQKIYATSQTNGKTAPATITHPEYTVATVETTPPSSSLKATISATGPSNFGWIMLRFSGNVPANKTVFLKVSANEANVKAEAYNSSGKVTGTQYNVITAPDGSYYYAVQAPGTFNEVRLTATGGSGLLGIPTNTSIDLYHAFYETNVCGSGLFTSKSAGGLLGGSADSIQNAIDTDLSSASILTPSLLGGSISQTVYFSGPSVAGDQVVIVASTPKEALQLSLLTGIKVSLYNGSSTTDVYNIGVGNLLSLDLLTLLKDGKPVAFSIIPPPGVIFDRMTIELASVLNLSGSMKIHEIWRTAQKPTFSVQNATICSGATATLTATAPTSGNEIRWYTTLSGGTPVIGNPFTTPALTVPTTYYVATGKIGCISESERVAAVVSINPLPTITLTSAESACQETGTLSFPYSATTGSPTKYSIVWDSNAISKGFLNVTEATLPTNTITITKPTGPNVLTGAYNGTLTVTNGTCTSIGTAITVTVLPKPAAPNVNLHTNSQY